jgi:site-specific recombinase XerD
MTGGETTWTVVSDSHTLVEPIEQYLEFARQSEFSPNTIKTYARGLALWWSYLEKSDRQWDTVQLSDFGHFLMAVRTGQFDPFVRQLHPEATVTEATVAIRIRPVMSFYRYHAAFGVDAASFLYEHVRSRPARYMPILEHIARRNAQRRTAIRVRLRNRQTPLLEPDSIDALIAAEASCAPTGDWSGDLRYRFLWTLLAETGMRIGEALSLQHRDWNTSRGDTASVAIVPRPHPHGLIPKSGYRKVFVGSRLDRLYGDFVWWLCEHGADGVIDDWDSGYIFCNTRREPLYAPLRGESVYAHLRAMKRKVPQLPEAMTPHWFRHSHATALLLAGTPLHVVSRRLGHRDVQTTINRYGHVTEDAELEALANWRDVVSGWETKTDVP